MLKNLAITVLAMALCFAGTVALFWPRGRR